MKKNWLVMLVFAVTVIACDDGNNDDPPQKQTPIAADFNINGIGTIYYDGTAKIVTITPKTNKSTGAITIYYNGSITAPIATGTYSITFDVVEAEGFNASNGLLAGVLTIVIPPFAYVSITNNVPSQRGRVKLDNTILTAQNGNDSVNSGETLTYEIAGTDDGSTVQNVIITYYNQALSLPVSNVKLKNGCHYNITVTFNGGEVSTPGNYTTTFADNNE